MRIDHELTAVGRNPGGHCFSCIKTSFGKEQMLRKYWDICNSITTAITQLLKMEPNKNIPKMPTTITPFLVVDDGLRALEFYKSGFGAEEVACYDMTGGRLTAKISIDGAEFWIGDEEMEFGNYCPKTIGGSPVRITLTVADPDTLFAQALKAGATQICPVTIEEAWKIGKLKDPFGHIWEIGHPL